MSDHGRSRQEASSRGFGGHRFNAPTHTIFVTVSTIPVIKDNQIIAERCGKLTGGPRYGGSFQRASTANGGSSPRYRELPLWGCCCHSGRRAAGRMNG